MAEPIPASLEDLSARVKAREILIDQSADAAVDLCGKTIKLVFQQGEDLLAAKAACRHGEWELWLEVNFPKGPRTARRYMQLGAIPKRTRMSVFTQSKSLRNAYLTAGLLLPEPEKETESDPGFTNPPVVQRLLWLAEWTGRNADDVATWEPARRQDMKIKLKPIVQLYERL